MVKENISFTNKSNKNPRYHCNLCCNQSGIYISKSGTNRLIEHLLFALRKFDC